jgi:hypothetical protein
MLHSVQPITLIVLAVTVVHYPQTLTLAVIIVAVVAIAIRPNIFSISVFFVVFPLPAIDLAIVALHNGIAIKIVIDKVSLKDAAFLHEDSLSVLFIVQEFTVISALAMVHSLPLAIG